MPVEKTIVELVSDVEVRMRRSFDAPRALVWEAMSNPVHVGRWYGLEALKMVVCEIDHRVGGKWRFVLRAPDGSEHAYSGEYTEIRAPERVVHTENYEPLGPGHELVVSTTLREEGGRTTLTSTLVYRTKADRDGHLQAGMEHGANESHTRLARLLSQLTGVRA